METYEYKKLLHTAIRGAIKEFIDSSPLEMLVLKHSQVPKYTKDEQAESELLSLLKQDVSIFLKNKGFQSEDEQKSIFYILGEKYLNTIHSFFNGRSDSFRVKLPRVSSKREVREFIREFFDKLSNKFLETFDLDKVPSLSSFLFTKEVYMEDIYANYEDYSVRIDLENFYVIGDYLNVKISFDFIPSLYFKNNELVVFKKAFMKTHIPFLLHIPREELLKEFLLTLLIEELENTFGASVADIIKAVEVVFLEQYKLAYITAFEPGDISPKAALMYNGEHYRLIVQNLKQSKEVLDNLVDVVGSGYKNFLSQEDDLIRDNITFGYIAPKLFGQNVKGIFNPSTITDDFDKKTYTKLFSHFSEKIGRSSVYLDPLSTTISLANSAYVFKPKMKINGKNLFIESRPIFRVIAVASGKITTLL
jgi:hypothetical protein